MPLAISIGRKEPIAGAGKVRRKVLLELAAFVAIFRRLEPSAYFGEHVGKNILLVKVAGVGRDPIRVVDQRSHRVYTVFVEGVSPIEGLCVSL